MFRVHFSRIPLAMLALAICTGTAQANTALLTTVTVGGGTLKCDTTSGPAAAVTGDTHALTITVKASSAATGNVIAVTVPSVPQGLTMVAPSPNTLSSASAQLVFTFTVTAATNCSAFSTAGANSISVQFNTAVGVGASGADVSQAVTVTVTNPATSPLSVSPSALTLSCTRNLDGSFTPGTSGSFSVTSSAVGGSPVTVDPASLPAWLQTPVNGGTATATALSFTAALQASCAGATGVVGSTKVATLHLINAPAPTTVFQTVKVTVQVVGPSQLTVNNGATSGSPISISYTKNQTALATGSTVVKTANMGSANLFFGLDTTTLPPWLTVNLTSGQTAGQTGVTLTFSITKVADSLVPGVYPSAGNPAQIKLKVAGYADTIVYVSLTVQNVASTLSVAEGTTRNLSWSVGQPLPSATITAESSGSPIAYSITSISGTANPSVSPMSGLAYGFGTPILVTFDPLAFAGAQPGAVLTGSVTIHWSSVANTDIVVLFSITINSPSTSAGLTGISPSNLPTATAGQTFLVTLYGSGFVSSTDLTQKTTVGIVTNAVTKAMTTNDPNITVNVLNAATIILTITVPAASPGDALLPWATQNNVILGVCNPGGTNCSTATGFATLTIGAGPTIQTNGVTSASTFQPIVAGTGLVAPYDLLTIFGNNFCTSNGTGCAANQVLYPTLDATLVYGTTLSPDNVRFLSVQFFPHGQTTGGFAAPLLFATNNQINLLVPGGIVTTSPTSYDIVVRFGPTPATALTSAPYQVVSTTNDPGIFVIDGASQGAIVLPSGAINDSSTAGAARMRAGAGESDIVSIYMTGLGTPSSTASDSSAGGSAVPTDCVSPANFQTANGGKLDGAVVQSSLIYSGRFVPCFDPATFTVKVGNQTATPTTVKFVGWTPDSVAGLYQVNVLLPLKTASLYEMDGVTSVASFTVPVQVPIVVNAPGSTHSQAKVGIWVQPAQTLKNATYPVLTGTSTVAALAGAATSAVTIDTVTATGGTTPNYSVTAASGTDALGHTAVIGDFQVDLTLGTVAVKYPFAAGTFTVTLTSTETGVPALPTETITLTLTVTP